MKIIVIRHAEVDFCWSRRCTSEGFDSDCREYDNAPIKGMTCKKTTIRYQRIYISTLPRSRDTAVKLFPNDKCIEQSIDAIPFLFREGLASKSVGIRIQQQEQNIAKANIYSCLPLDSMI